MARRILARLVGQELMMGVAGPPHACLSALGAPWGLVWSL
jgi:hypothetical protein